jgi:hypothetical protein
MERGAEYCRIEEPPREGDENCLPPYEEPEGTAWALLGSDSHTDSASIKPTEADLRVFGDEGSLWDICSDGRRAVGGCARWETKALERQRSAAAAAKKTVKERIRTPQSTRRYQSTPRTQV